MSRAALTKLFKRLLSVSTEWCDKVELTKTGIQCPLQDFLLVQRYARCRGKNQIHEFAKLFEMASLSIKKIQFITTLSWNFSYGLSLSTKTRKWITLDKDTFFWVGKNFKTKCLKNTFVIISIHFWNNQWNSMKNFFIVSIIGLHT